MTTSRPQFHPPTSPWTPHSRRGELMRWDSCAEWEEQSERAERWRADTDGDRKWFERESRFLLSEGVACYNQQLRPRDVYLSFSTWGHSGEITLTTYRSIMKTVVIIEAVCWSALVCHFHRKTLFCLLFEVRGQDVPRRPARGQETPWLGAFSSSAFLSQVWSFYFYGSSSRPLWLKVKHQNDEIF